MGSGLDISVLMADEADAYLTGYNTKFVDAPIGQASVYLEPYMYTPSEGIDDRVRTVRFPIPLTAVELKLFEGESRFTKGSTRYIEVEKQPYQAGEAAFYKMIVDPAWTGFNQSPEHLRKLCASWPSKNGAALINTGETIASWKGGNFLSTSVPTNPFRNGSTTDYKVFWAATTLSHDNVLAMIAEMSARGDLDGDPIPMSDLRLFASAALYPLALTIAKDDYISGTQITNPVKKWNITAEAWHHLLPTRWGLINGAAAMDEYPIFNVLKGTEELYVYGKDSAMFEQKKEMGYEVMKDLGIALARNEGLIVASTV